MIAVRDIQKRFGRVPAVRDVSFTLEPGQVVGLLGANGAGKTTTIRMITGYLLPDAGSVRVGGIDLATDPVAARRRLGYLPESAPVYPEMSVADYLRFRASLHAMQRREARAAIARVLDRCLISDAARRRIGHLSKGYRQRVGLAGALLHDPPVLVLDEPTDGLDPAQVRQVRELIRDLGRTRTILVSSHIVPEVEKTCDRVLIMAAGRIRVDARPADLIAARGRGPYVLEVRRAPGGIDPRAAASQVVGVAEVRVAPVGSGAGEWLSLRLRPRDDAPDLREAIACAMASAGLTVRELRREEPGLERVVLDLLDAGEDEPGATSPQAAARDRSAQPAEGPA